jgi:4'-phosphopantetheinyl transferase
MLAGSGSVTAGEMRWDLPCGVYAVADHQVDVFRTAPGWSAASIARLKAILSPDEQRRADRFYQEIDFRRHVVGRGLLRLLLGQCFGVAPDRLCFQDGQFGKPALAGEVSPRLQFNLSHSGDLIVIAIVPGHAVGVDVEKIRPDIALDRIAQDFFSPQECASLATLDGPSQLDGFYACWTRKEAWIKARGEGLSLPLRQFDVSVAPDQPAQLLGTRPDPAEAGRWMLSDLDVGSGYRAALAVNGSGWRLKTWQWPAGFSLCGSSVA